LQIDREIWMLYLDFVHLAIQRDPTAQSPRGEEMDGNANVERRSFRAGQTSIRDIAVGRLPLA
jgi:hypothetical protein